MTQHFNPADWYWVVAGSTTEVYASARNIYVPIDDADYVAWLAATGNAPPPVPVEADVWPYVSVPPRSLPAWLFNGTTFAQPAVDAYTQDQLRDYSVVARDETLVGGITVNGLPFSTDLVTVGSLNSAYIYTQTNVGATFSWKLPDGSFVTVDKAGVEALQNAVSLFGQECYACEDTLLDGIDGGTVTTTADVDAAFDAINKTFTGLSGVTNRRHQRK